MKIKDLGEYLAERYINLIGKDKEKEEYAEEVFDMLTRSYAKIGGLKMNGLSSKEEMVKQIPFWKLSKKNDKIVAVALYKDKAGIKIIAVSTDGTEEGKKALQDIYKSDFDRAYFEVSGASLGLILRTVGEDFALKYVKRISEVKKIMGDNAIEEANPKSPEIEIFLKKYPKITQYFYQREIAGKMHHKILLGKTGKVILEPKL